METDKALKALEEIGWGPYSTKLCLACGMVISIQAWLCFEAWTTSMSYTQEGLKSEYQVSDVSLGFIGASFQAGLFFGYLLTGILSDKYGRKLPYLSSSILAFIASLIITLSFHFYMAVTGFFFLGVSMSFEVNLTPTIISEFIPPTKRFVLTAISISFSIGSFLVCVIALIVELSNRTSISNWRFINGFLTILQLINIVPRFWIQETPEFLFKSNKIQEAENVLNKISIANKKKRFSFESLETNEQVVYNEDNDEQVETRSNKESRGKFGREFWINVAKLGIVRSI